MTDQTKRTQTRFNNTAPNAYRGTYELSAVDLNVEATSLNYLLAKPNQVLPAFSPDLPIWATSFGPDAPGNPVGPSYEFRFMVSPSKQAVEREFVVSAYSVSSSLFQLQIDDGPATDFLAASVSPSSLSIRQVVQNKTSSSFGTDNVQQVGLKINVSGSFLLPGEDIYKLGPIIDSISGYEIPRPIFNPVTEPEAGGVDVSSLQPEASLFDARTNQYSSVVSLARNVKLAQKKSKRTVLSTWAVPLLVGSNINVDPSTSGISSVFAVTGSGWVDLGSFHCQASPSFSGAEELYREIDCYFLGHLTIVGDYTCELEISGPSSLETAIIDGSLAASTNPYTWRKQDGIIVPVTQLNSDRGMGPDDDFADGLISVRARLQGSLPGGDEGLRLHTFQIIDVIDK